MEHLSQAFQDSLLERNGSLLADTIVPQKVLTDSRRLDAFYWGAHSECLAADVYRSLSRKTYRGIAQPEKKLVELWTDIYVCHWSAIKGLVELQLLSQEHEPKKLATQWQFIYAGWKELANCVIRAYNSGHLENWTLPVLYIVAKQLRIFAIKADVGRQAASSGDDMQMSAIQEMTEESGEDMGKNRSLEDAARVINRMFTLCISDRASMVDSRKWGLYYIANSLFKTYFRLNSISLSKNILRALAASKTDMPELAAFPRSHIVTFQYYVGVIHFLEEDYAQAEINLTKAYRMIHHAHKANKALILMYLIPTRMCTTRQLPSSRLLKSYPELKNIFGPLASAIRSGSLAGFDAALAAGADVFVRRRIYLTLERSRDICLRNVFRRVFLSTKVDAADGARRTRIKIDEFAAGIAVASMGAVASISSEDESERLGNDEVECLLANMIYKNLIKGYISRQASTVVLSKTGAFPGTGV